MIVSFITPLLLLMMTSQILSIDSGIDQPKLELDSVPKGPLYSTRSMQPGKSRAKGRSNVHDETSVPLQPGGNSSPTDHVDEHGKPGGMGRPDGHDKTSEHAQTGSNVEPNGTGKPDGSDKPDRVDKPDGADRPGGNGKPGGQEPSAKHNFLAYIYIENCQSICAGIFLTPNQVLTVSHCVIGKDKSAIRVYPNVVFYKPSCDLETNPYPVEKINSDPSSGVAHGLSILTLATPMPSKPNDDFNIKIYTSHVDSMTSLNLYSLISSKPVVFQKSQSCDFSTRSATRSLVNVKKTHLICGEIEMAGSSVDQSCPLHPGLPLTLTTSSDKILVALLLVPCPPEIAVAIKVSISYDFIYNLTGISASQFGNSNNTSTLVDPGSTPPELPDMSTLSPPGTIGTEGGEEGEQGNRPPEAIIQPTGAPPSISRPTSTPGNPQPTEFEPVSVNTLPNFPTTTISNQQSTDARPPIGLSTPVPPPPFPGQVTTEEPLEGRPSTPRHPSFNPDQQPPNVIDPEFDPPTPLPHPPPFPEVTTTQETLGGRPPVNIDPTSKPPSAPDLALPGPTSTPVVEVAPHPALPTETLNPVPGSLPDFPDPTYNPEAEVHPGYIGRKTNQDKGKQNVTNSNSTSEDPELPELSSNNTLIPKLRSAPIDLETLANITDLDSDPRTQINNENRVVEGDIIDGCLCKCPRKPRNNFLGSTEITGPVKLTHFSGE